MSTIQTEVAAPSPAVQTDAAPQQTNVVQVTTFAIILAISFCHFLNDLMQTLLASIYPILKADFGLDFWQIGMLTFAFQATASLLQPVIGAYTDKRPLPYSLPFGMASTLIGLLVLAYAHSYATLMLGACLIGFGSAVFHPESSRVARMASGGRYGLAQAVFQVGGNFGSAIGPLLAAFIIVPRGQTSVAWFSAAAFIGMIILVRVGRWYSNYHRGSSARSMAVPTHNISKRRVQVALLVLALLVFTKNIYTAGMSSFYTFYAIEIFGVSVKTSQLLLFVYLGATALGTVLGGPFGDKIGAKNVIWFSIIGSLPFTLAMPYVGLEATVILTAIIGLVMASAFPAIVVAAQELVPGRVGMIAGIFFGFAFGMGGIAAAVLGVVADRYGISTVFQICSYLPFLGLLTIFLPNMTKNEA